MIENTVTGEVFQTSVLPMTAAEAKLLKKKDWLFDWPKETAVKDRQVYRLTTLENPKVVQGMLSVSDGKDHIFLHLVENATFNRGKKKLYRGTASNLIAFGCKLSFEKQYDGYVLFISKTALVSYYQEAMGAKVLAGSRMYIDTAAARKLTAIHFPNLKF